MKNRDLIILVLVIILAISGALLYYNQNFSQNIDKNNTSNEANNLTNNKTKLIDNKTNETIQNEIIKEKNHNGKKSYSDDSKETKLSYNEVLKIANNGIPSTEYAKIGECYSFQGELYWSIRTYDKKTGKYIGTFSISDKTGSKTLM